MSFFRFLFGINAFIVISARPKADVMSTRALPFFICAGKVASVNCPSTLWGWWQMESEDVATCQRAPTLDGCSSSRRVKSNSTDCHWPGLPIDGIFTVIRCVMNCLNNITEFLNRCRFSVEDIPMLTLKKL